MAHGRRDGEDSPAFAKRDHRRRHQNQRQKGANAGYHDQKGTSGGRRIELWSMADIMVLPQPTCLVIVSWIRSIWTTTLAQGLICAVVLLGLRYRLSVYTVVR
jgi:hypothetical protein